MTVLTLTPSRAVRPNVGMGGHQGGEVASALALQILGQAHDEPLTASLVKAVRSANQDTYWVLDDLGGNFGRVWARPLKRMPTTRRLSATYLMTSTAVRHASLPSLQ